MCWTVPVTPECGIFKECERCHSTRREGRIAKASLTNFPTVSEKPGAGMSAKVTHLEFRSTSDPPGGNAWFGPKDNRNGDKMGSLSKLLRGPWALLKAGFDDLRHPPPNNRPVLDLLRSLAIVFVLFFHVAQFAPHSMRIQRMPFVRFGWTAEISNLARHSFPGRVK